jgi:bacterioferritin-associated ferredoxin/DNA-binding NarL/FixJ family response regulator
MSRGQNRVHPIAESSTRIAIIDENPVRRAILEEGLREAGYSDVVHLSDTFGLIERIATLNPEIILIDLENPSRDILEQMFQMSRVVKRPIAMFVDQSDTASIEAAVDAGVSGFARVATALGSCVLLVRISAGQQKGSVFVPIHWSAETSSSARVGELVMPAIDPHSGQPEAKATPASIAPVDYRSRGFVLTREPLTLPTNSWWARVAIEGGVGFLFATNETQERWRDWVSYMFPRAELAEFIDAPRAVYRAAAFRNDRLEACLFLGPAGATPCWDAVKGAFSSETLDKAQRRMILSGHSLDGLSDTGPLICACFGVGLATIRDAIASGTASNVEEIGKTLRAGSNCGSCLPELRRIVQAAPVCLTA